MTTLTHLAPDEAALYAAGLLEPTVRARIDEHIDACADCRELISAVARVAASTLNERETRAATSQHEVVLPRGTRVGPYELMQPLGAGGMGLVYLAFDARLNRQVALKCVRDSKGDPQQLLNEARLMAQLAHPNVVSVYDLVEANEQRYLAMELVTGSPLSQWLTDAPRTWREIVDAFMEAGAGLAAAHEAGIIHGDVKPANMLRGDDGRVRVTDFGLASLGVDDSGALRGTEVYMAPEQRKGDPCDQRSDQYAFAVSLHEALFGVLPTEPRKRRGRVPSSVRRLLDRALSRSPERRFPSMRALLAALRLARLARWRYVAVAVVAAGLFVVVSFGAGGRQATLAQCEAAASQLDTGWTPEARAASQAAYQRTGASYADEAFTRVGQSLDRWNDEFSSAKTAICQARWFALEAAPALPRQLACLKEAGQDSRALVTQLLDADVALVLRGVGVTQQLPELARCLEPPKNRSLPTTGASADEVNALIAKTRALAAAGRYALALEAAREASVAADRSQDPSLRAAAMALLAGAKGLAGDLDEAIKLAWEAVRVSELAQEDRARALVWSDIVSFENLRGRHDEVIALSPAALGACERIDDVRLLTEVMGTLGSSLSEKGRHDEALVWLEEAVRRRAAAFGERDRRTAAVLSTLANSMAMSGNLAGATEAHRRALEAAEASFGPAHPETSVIRNNLGDDYLYGLELERAQPHFERAVADLDKALGPQSRNRAISNTDLGFTHLFAGRAQRALELFESCVATWEAHFPRHPTRALALLGRHQASLELGGEPRVADLELALTLADELPVFERGRVRLALGLALSDLRRARELVKSARDDLSTTPLPLIAREKQRAEAWLSAHP